MKPLRFLFTITVFIISVTACKNTTSDPEVKTIAIESSSKKNTKQVVDPNATYAKVEFSIDGMTCAMGCARTIEKKIAKMEGVKMAKVDFDKELAMVEYDEAKVTPKSLEETVTKVGKVYKVKDIKVVDTFSN